MSKNYPFVRTFAPLIMSAICCSLSVAYGAQQMNVESSLESDLKADSKGGQQLTSLPLALRQTVQNGAKILKTFPAAGGFNGHILQTAPRHYSVVYTEPNNEDVLVVGTLLNGKGENLTSRYLDEYAPKVNYDEYSSRVMTARQVVSGSSKNNVQDIYVFMDPNCIFCHLLWKALTPYERHGLRVHWIPVGFLKKDSFGKAAALLDASNPTTTLNAMETGYIENTESAFIEPEVDIPGETSKELISNKGLFDELGFAGTPAILYRDHSGHWQSLQGMPRLSTLSTVLSLPLQPEMDPELARFR